MNYAGYKRALRADFACYQRAKVYYEALYDRMEVSGAMIVPHVRDQTTFEKGIKEGETADKMLLDAKLALRIQTVAFAQVCKKSIVRRLGVVESKYFAKVRKHRGLPMVSYDAVTTQSVREFRAGLTASLAIPDHRDPDLGRISDDEWIRKLRGYEKALNELKEKAKALSTQIVAWEKAVDDKWRLNFAMVGIFATLAIFAYREFKESWAEGAGRESPVMIDIDLH